MHLACLSKAVKGVSKKQLLKENQQLREENARLRQEVALLRQKMDLLIRRLFGRSSEKLDANQLDLFLLSPENEPGKVDASSLEEADPRHEPRGKREARCRERWPADLPVVEEIIDPKEVQKAPEHLALDRCGSERTTRLRTRTVPAPAIGAPQIRAAWRPGSDSHNRDTAAESAGALHRSARTSRPDHRQQVLRSPCATSEGWTDVTAIRATARPMREGPSGPADRSGSQITSGGRGQKPRS
jgi:hypothetical protein